MVSMLHYTGINRHQGFSALLNTYKKSFDLETMELPVKLSELSSEIKWTIAGMDLYQIPCIIKNSNNNSSNNRLDDEHDTNSNKILTWFPQYSQKMLRQSGNDS